MTSVIPCKNHKRTFLGHPLQSLIEFNPLNTPYKFLTYSPTHLSGMQHQELGLALDIGKHSQSQRNYEQNLVEMTPELWLVSYCDELMGKVSHTIESVTDLLSRLSLDLKHIKFGKSYKLMAGRLSLISPDPSPRLLSSPRPN